MHVCLFTEGEREYHPCIEPGGERNKDGKILEKRQCRVFQSIYEFHYKSLFEGG